MASEVGANVQTLERNSVPVHFPGMVAHWPALQLWRGDSGLQRLLALAGDARVEVLASPASSGRSYGDMQHLILLGCTLREFLEGSLARQLHQHQPQGAEPLTLYLAQSPLAVAAAVAPPLAGDKGGGGGACCGPGGVTTGTGSGGGDRGGGRGSGVVCEAQPQLQPGPLHGLMRDLGVPALLLEAPLSQINLWASMSSTRSSLHYDPYTNLLCLVRGSKSVWLAPPSTTPHLSPQPLTAESANHSPADLARPDLERFPQLAQALPQVQSFHLAPGDALFIPEGWWHQVDSREGTLAVNFWWESGVSRQLGGHMDRYFLRRLMQSLVEQQKQAALAALPRCDLLQLAAATAACSQKVGCREGRTAGKAGGQVQEEAGEQVQQAVGGQQAVYGGQQAAGENSEGQFGPASIRSQQQTGTASGLPPEQFAAVALLESAVAEHQAAGPDCLPPPLVACIVATLAASSAQALLDTLLHLRSRQPGLAAHLLLHSLDPAGWEVLSGCMERRQEELAAAGGAAEAEEAVGAACDALYSAVDDRSALLEAILARKQEFAQQALRAVLDAELAGCL